MNTNKHPLLVADCNVSGPRVLWSLYFNLDMCTVEQGGASWSADLPSNLFVTSDPDATRSYESAVQEVVIRRTMH